MAFKWMHIPNDDTQKIPSVDCNKWLKHLDTQLYDPTNKGLINDPKVVKHIVLFFPGSKAM